MVKYRTLFLYLPLEIPYIFYRLSLMLLLRFSLVPPPLQCFTFLNQPLLFTFYQKKSPHTRCKLIFLLFIDYYLLIEIIFSDTPCSWKGDYYVKFNSRQPKTSNISQHNSLFRQWNLLFHSSFIFFIFYLFFIIYLIFGHYHSLRIP